MAKHTKTKRRRAADDLLHSLRELAAAIESGVPLNERFTVRTVSIPAADSSSQSSARRGSPQAALSPQSSGNLCYNSPAASRVGR
jgi:hypothetical protein